MVVAAIDHSSKKAAPAAKKETPQKQKVEKKEDKKEVQEKPSNPLASGLFSQENKDRFAKLVPAKPAAKEESKPQPKPKNRHQDDDLTVYVGNLPSLLHFLGFIRSHYHSKAPGAAKGVFEVWKHQEPPLPLRSCAVLQADPFRQEADEEGVRHPQQPERGDEVRERLYCVRGQAIRGEGSCSK